MKVSEDDIVSAKNTFSKFSKEGFRPGQFDAIKWAAESPKKVVVLCAPTGTGKSLVGMVTGRLHDRYCYLCSSKQLQRQLVEDFKEAKVMKGRNNFPCVQHYGFSASDCRHSKSNPCASNKGGKCDRTECLYKLEKCSVAAHPYQILNYHYFLFESTYIGWFSDYPIVIADEADVLDNILTDFISLGITQKVIDELNLSLPYRKTTQAQDGLSSWVDWADMVRKKAKKQIEYFAGELKTTPNSEDALHGYKRYEGLKNKLDRFLPSVDESWILEVKDPKFLSRSSPTWVFRPTWLTPQLSHDFFWRHADKFLLVSATFPPPEILAKTLGVEPDDIDYAEMGAAFPVAHRPVHISPVANLAYKTFNDEVDKLLEKIEQIVDEHEGERGIIHTVSWKLNRLIMDMDNPRFITHNNGEWPKEDAIARFLDTPGAVFVSPSSMRGMDLPDDACRFSIICKAPFKSLGDKLTSTRTYSSKSGNSWYKSMAAQDIVQAVGRGVRHKEDWCKSYVLDRQGYELIVRNRRLFPDYFIEAVDIV